MKNSLLPHWRRGINLGNSLDAIGGETAWNNPITTQPMIQMYADAGFNILRLPITWSQHIGPAPDYTVDPAWMARVLEVAGWGVNAGMAVIVNVHHDFDWIRPQLSTLADILPKFIALWKQIAVAFAGYSDEIILQSLNEPNLFGGLNDQTVGTRDVRSAINALNHAFVRTVRESGGNNATRWLCVPPLAARPLPECLRDMIVPEDDKIIMTIHSYYPERFCFEHPGQESTPVFDKTVEQELHHMFETVKTYALPHNVPIMMTEFGAVTKLLPDGKTRNDEERVKFVKAYLTQAEKLGIPCVWWDNNYYDAGDEWFGLYDRSSLTCNSPSVVSALLTQTEPR